MKRLFAAASNAISRSLRGSFQEGVIGARSKGVGVQTTCRTDPTGFDLCNINGPVKIQPPIATQVWQYPCRIMFQGIANYRRYAFLALQKGTIAAKGLCKGGGSRFMPARSGCCAVGGIARDCVASRDIGGHQVCIAITVRLDSKPLNYDFGGHILYRANGRGGFGSQNAVANC